MLGAIGQVIRVVIGIKKLKEKQSEAKQQNEENIRNAQQLAAASGTPAQTPTPVLMPEFSGQRLSISILIGFSAGVLAALFGQDDLTEGKSFYAAIIAAGYSGADFIESFMSKFWNKQSTASTPTN